MSAESNLTPLIVGCWQLDDRSWKPIPEPSIERAIDTYLALGINCFDTADIYGRSEQVLGRLLKGRDCRILTKAVFFGGIPSPSQIRNKYREFAPQSQLRSSRYSANSLAPSRS